MTQENPTFEYRTGDVTQHLSRAAVEERLRNAATSDILVDVVYDVEGSELVINKPRETQEDISEIFERATPLKRFVERQRNYPLREPVQK